ncbi:T9SS type A sorting domain-containing protein [candidate division GN15 bacterium]|nr:T9SS type A sorting domain-containing protein [candidate division GN15 bacterium]
MTTPVGLPKSLELQDFRVNDDGSGVEQNHPRIAVANDGSFAIVWEDRRAGVRDIYLQRFDADGVPIGSNRMVNDDAIDAYQSEPAVAVDLSGLYSVVWKDYRNSSYPFDPDIFFQRFDSAVSPIDANRRLTTEWPDSLKETPDIALSSWGGGVVVWADYRNQNWDIYGQLISSNGALIGSNFRVNDDHGGAQQHAPRIDISPEGWFVVTWYDNRTGNDDIFVQRFDSLANPLGVNLRVNSNSGDSRQAFPDVATDGAGHFTVVWVDWRNGAYPANPDIYARKFDTMLVPVTSDTRVNAIGNNAAQREPTISADRRGNVAIIWSDSTGSSWDITGQMIDVNGTIQEPNFQANFESDSAQLHPDVALDGRYRYITWSDKRNGDFDIYASVVQYNDPTLIPDPASLRFEMVVGGELPESQTVTVEHAGYNPLHFTAKASQDWFAVAPVSGVTPEDLAVEVTSDTLGFGTYFGSITLVDTDNNDSSTVVSVRLDVTAPMLSVSVDTVGFSAFEGIDREYSQTVTIGNAGGGNLTWTAIEEIDWLSLSHYSGGNSDDVTLMVNASGLTNGDYVEPVVIDAGDVMASPDTLWVVLQVVDNQPYLEVEPDSIRLATVEPDSAVLFVVVTNAGVGILSWQAQVHDPWLIASRLSGLSGDTIHLSINTASLPLGYHATWIDVTDSASFNVTERIPVAIEYLEPSADTIEISSTQVALDSPGSAEITLTAVNTVSSMYLPLQYDTLRVAVDSVSFDQSLAGYVTGSYTVDSSAGIVTVEIQSTLADSSLAPGAFVVGSVHFTATDVAGQFMLMPPVSEAWSPRLVRPDSGYLQPEVLPGTIQVGTATAVEDAAEQSLPDDFFLAQNYPNPFNSSTVIEVSLPERAEVKLELFNILGQRVRLLADGPLAAGSHQIEWDGAYAGGRSAPTGIYFYRLQAGDVSLVRKMLLLK